MQLAAFNDNNFALGHAAMLVNEGLPLYVVSQLDEQHDLAELHGRHPRVRRSRPAPTTSARASPTSSSGSCPSRRSAVLMTDPYVTTDPDLVPLEQVLERGRRADRRDAAPGVPRHRHRQAGRRRVERPAAQGYGMSADVPAGHGRDPGVQRGDRHRPGPRPVARGGARCPARCWSSSTSPDDTTVAGGRRVRRARAADRASGGQRLRPRARRTRSATASTRRRRRSWS